MRTALVFLIFFLCSSAHAIPVHIYNDLDTEPEGKIVEVESVETTQSKRMRYRLKIYPNETIQISRGSVINFKIARIFPAHKVKYEVTCPKNGSEVTINILQIHEDKLPGGCELLRRGHWSRRTGLNWTKPGD